jgi:hypothetical protein
MRQHPLDHERALKTLRTYCQRQEDFRHPTGANPIDEKVLAERLCAGER